MKTETYFLYEGREDCRLDAYILDPSEEFGVGKKRPAVLVCPGGAYVYCSAREAEPVAMRFLSMGYDAFVLRYTTFRGIDGKKWPEDVYQLPEMKKETVYPGPLCETGRAMVYIKEHAGEWGIDASGIGICGFSAGGHNCALYSSVWNRPFLAEAVFKETGKEISDSEKAELLRPAFCILGYPFIDWLYNYEYPYDEYSRASYRWMYLDYFGTADPTEEQMKEASANYQVTEYNPPTFMWHTFTDSSVPVMHTIKMAEALAAHKVPVEYHLFPTGAHGLVFADQSTAGNNSQNNPIVGQWTGLLYTWLKNTAPVLQ